MLRFDEYRRTLDLLKRTDAIRNDRPLTEAEEGGLVQFFCLSVELGWKTMASYLRSQGVKLSTMAPLVIIREAMRSRLVDDGDAWSGAVELRNTMAHTYDPDAFHALIADAAQRYLPMLESLRERMETLS